MTARGHPGYGADVVDADVTDRAAETRERRALAAWMDEHGIGTGELSAFEPLSGGTQNVMVAFRRGADRYVLRRGPRNPRPRSNDVLLREMTLLRVLAGTDVPHARLLGACPDREVLGGSVFFLTAYVDGVNPAVAVPQAYDGAMLHDLGAALVDALVAVGEVDHRRPELVRFGRPEGFLERQVPRWMSELASYADVAGYRPTELGAGSVADWLEARRPRLATAGLMHGDFQLANVLVATDRPRVAAVVDWEMATVGDPLLDLGWLLATWARPGDPEDVLGSAYSRAGCRPSEAELVERYVARSGRDVSSLDWYVVLACFKLGILLEGTYARACAGEAPRDTGARLHAMTVELFARAHARMRRA